MIPAGSSCRGCPSQAWYLSLIRLQWGPWGLLLTSQTHTHYLSSPTRTGTWSFLLSLWLGADQGGPWAGSYILELPPPCPSLLRNPAPNTLCGLKSLLFHHWWVGFQAPPGGLSLGICSRQSGEMSGATAGCQNFTQGVSRTFTGTGK